MAGGTGRLHVSFRQSSGRLTGTCWCGRAYASDDPKDVWTWLDDHIHGPSHSPSDS
jgi:hypothetical protein